MEVSIHQKLWEDGRIERWWWNDALLQGLGLLQRLDGVAYVRVQPGAAGIEMRQDRGPHPGIPEFSDVIGDPRDRLVVALAPEE
jgi:hypothetical protein